VHQIRQRGVEDSYELPTAKKRGNLVQKLNMHSIPS
jgi:hypothetical protein